MLVISGFLLAAFVPLMKRMWGENSTYVAALLPLGLTIWYAFQYSAIVNGETLSWSRPWIEALGVHFSFQLDGLSLLFSLMIAGIGVFIVLYTKGYLHGHPMQHRFVMFTLMFMASMLGVVSADNVILLFIFWELTSFTSYLLIGFNHDEEASRKASLQALLVTGCGGLFLLAGLILMSIAAGTTEISGMIAQRDSIIDHPHYPVMLGLVLIGAFTKSAQTPFHFWLPNAMQAPTPASAYLHSSTMVKAGVYLLARLSPVLGGTPEWIWVLTGIGVLTLITGAVLASGQTYLKRLLAYTTVAALGAMVMAIGIGTPKALQAAVVFLLAHACYKAALFLVAGIIDHETGEKNVTKLGGLRKYMPLTGIAAMIAAASMAGIPLAFGFIGKEMLYTAVLHHPALTGLTIIAGAFFMLVAWQTGVRPFIASVKETPKHPHDPPWMMLAGPVVLGIITLSAGIIPGTLFDGLAGAATAAILAHPVDLHLHLWHGINTELLLSIVTIVLGAVAIILSAFWIKSAGKLRPCVRFGPDQGYQNLLAGLVNFAKWQTRMLQGGSLRRYLIIIVITMCGLFVMYFIRANFAFQLNDLTPISPPLVILSILVIIAGVAATMTNSRLGAVAAMGVVGFSAALFFIYFGAPDLAMTQLVIETLSIVLLVLAFYYLPPFATRSTWRGRMRDGVVAIFAGTVVTLLILVANGVQLSPAVSEYYAETSVPLAHGRNIVNVILVDYRGLDTLGEITVLAVAGIGSYALLRLRIKTGGKS